MGRIARVVMPGYPHHVTQRGVRSMDLFGDDADRREYLRLMAEYGRGWGLAFLSWCLMDNHVHLIVVPEAADSLARGIGEAHRRYTRYVNFNEGVRGYLFQGRFFSCPLDERHLIAAARYVERNPVRAGVVERAWDYRWSSARFHVGRRKGDPLVSERDLLGLVDDWRGLLRQDPEDPENPESSEDVDLLRERVRTGRACGADEFIAKAERLTGRSLRPHPPGPCRRGSAKAR